MMNITTAEVMAAYLMRGIKSRGFILRYSNAGSWPSLADSMNSRRNFIKGIRVRQRHDQMGHLSHPAWNLDHDKSAI